MGLPDCRDLENLNTFSHRSIQFLEQASNKHVRNSSAQKYAYADLIIVYGHQCYEALTFDRPMIDVHIDTHRIVLFTVTRFFYAASAI